MTEREIWERQEYDTSTSFDRFQRYYLAQDPPRSVDEAYRRWLVDEGRKRGERGAKRRATTRWQIWAWPKGDDAKSWPERAQAFDDHLAQLRQAEWEARHMPAPEVLALLADQARGNIGDFAIIENGNDLANHPKSPIVKKFKKKIYHPKNSDPYEEIELELYDAHASLVDIAKHHGLFSDETGSSDKKPFVVKVVRGVSTDDI